MKTKFSIIFFLTTLAMASQSFRDPYINLKKKITDKQFRYEFYTTDKKVTPRLDISYYWFKGGAIHTTEQGVAGELLNEQFDKFFLNNQLAEKGKFKNGRKVGTWRTWHQNGMLATEAEWAGGQKNGNFKSFDENGVLIEKGLYRVDKKQGKWINYVRKDTLKYRNDKVVVKKIKKIKQQKEAEKAQKETKKEDKPSGKETKKESVNKPVSDSKTKAKTQQSTKTTTPNTPEKKQSFFKRIFSKKSKTKTANVKGS